MMVAIVGFIALRYVASCRALATWLCENTYLCILLLVCMNNIKMAEQLLTEGQINEEELRLMSTDKAHCDIGTPLLTHSCIRIS